MLKIAVRGIVLLFTITFTSAHAQEFGFRIDMGLIQSDAITEASGIAASRKNPGVLWTHNDSGGQNRIFAFNTHGKHLGIYVIAGIQNRDWEDIAVGPGPIDGEEYVYIGDIGDNSARYDKKYIYRIREPRVDTTRTPTDTIITKAERFVFQYPDGNRDAETLMVDPPTGDIYVVSKREDKVHVYRAPYPQNFYSYPTTHTDTLEYVTMLNSWAVVGGDISASGSEILIKSYNKIDYWHREPGQVLWQALQQNPKQVPYVPEPQGEAVCWAADGSGYFTLSEERNNRPAHLYFYPRLENTIVHQKTKMPFTFKLGQNYPNPFNASTLISYTICKKSLVQVKILNPLGREIRRPVNEVQQPGNHSILFNAQNLTSGIYFYTLLLDGKTSRTKRMLLLK
ncbi:MAG: T9SS type A sorting domain-containing protein [Calditrichaeota bacterium]|nr:T9SS type A sorting domain-containing protein [Calditrichota bacterium]